jgi:prolyl 4-hydroxylase
LREFARKNSRSPKNDDGDMATADRGVPQLSLNNKMRLVLLLFLCLGFTESRSCRHCNNLAFAGGFGRDSSSSSSSSSKKNTAKREKRKGGLAEVPFVQTPSPPKKAPIEDESSSSPTLDKWGLPPATLDDIFPLMPPGTELIPIDTNKEYSLGDMQHLLKDHLDLRLDRYFDERGREKDYNGRPKMQLRLLHQSPPILAIDNFLTGEDCEKVKETVDHGGAYQVNSATFSGALSTRTSTSWFCQYAQVPMLLAKAHHALNIPLETMEEPQIVRYKQGQEFSWHYDEVPKPQLQNGGQRLATLLVYLGDIPSGGGGTIFRDLIQQLDGGGGAPAPLTMQPKKGSALLFFPAFRDGRPDDRTLHKGEIMVGNDEKWIVQMWIHEKAYQAVIPKGNSQEAARGAVERQSQELGYV